MACPSGCVNGGGQIRPPSQSDVDAAAVPQSGNADTDPEGYSKGGWVADQSIAGDDDLEGMLNNKSCSKKNPTANDEEMEEEKPIKGWQGTSKDWVRRVEDAYWQGSRVAHTPVNVVALNATNDSGASTPTLIGGGGSGASTPLSSAGSNAKSIRVEDHQRLLEALAVTQSSASKQRQRDEIVNVGTDAVAYADVLAELVVKELCYLSSPTGGDEAALEKARSKLFRTQYRAVQDEAVNGLAVQW